MDCTLASVAKSKKNAPAVIEYSKQVIATAADPAQPVQANDGISIKLSALHPRYEALQQERVMAELVPRVWGLCLATSRNTRSRLPTSRVRITSRLQA